MSDFMRWMYDHYIKPNIENQPKDDAENMWFDSLDNELDPQLRQTLQKALTFYAVQGFRLGVRTGVTLGGDLDQETKYFGSTCSHSHTPFSER